MSNSPEISRHDELLIDSVLYLLCGLKFLLMPLNEAALRSLAYKWIRIIFRCLQNRTRFDEVYYFTKTQERQAAIPA